MFGLETKLYNQLCLLRDEYNIHGIKAEFEAEGSSFRDLMRLRRLTSKAHVKLFLKIGGVEANRDIKDALEIGVDGIIAPMVESKFGAKKFYESLNKISYRECEIASTLNIETQIAIKNIDSILEFAQDKFDNITIGRSDLSASFFDLNIKPDSDFIFNLLLDVAKKIPKYNLKLAIGGNLSVHTLKKMDNLYQDLFTLINTLETRKVMLPSHICMTKPDCIKQALIFEELYILSKKEFSDLHIYPEITRLTELKRRLQ
ncbi:hypothetical protein DMB95_01450 [Campylobacter sp. MIT 12-8780]|uniref:aldolase/citrate lyase family protein n=1 Tax=unclassified Campylobacter TaxID=2593542 RepID=UPI00115F5931|nr:MULTISPECIES: aldolase/citrate lyase family protein [unclassified Campylobacter]NDJ26625.1 hypothetical protein [Campylobacter sp. MIT 19-121]TQR43186.1 hypothetical protein DMB95_01450 [Campylobacter sp. MIT 12-8780]